MFRAILKIFPEFGEKILAGTKKYEFRKTFIGSDGIFYLYELDPIDKIVGEVKVVSAIIDTPSNLWNSLKDYSGIDCARFFKYYSGITKGVAYKLGNFIKYDKYLDLKDFGIDHLSHSIQLLDG